MTHPITILHTTDKWRLDLWLLLEDHLTAWQIKRLVVAVRREYAGRQDRVIVCAENIQRIVTKDRHATRRTRELADEFLDWAKRPSLTA